MWIMCIEDPYQPKCEFKFHRPKRLKFGMWKGKEKEGQIQWRGIVWLQKPKFVNFELNFKWQKSLQIQKVLPCCFENCKTITLHITLLRTLFMEVWDTTFCTKCLFQWDNNNKNDNYNFQIWPCLLMHCIVTKSLTLRFGVTNDVISLNTLYDIIFGWWSHIHS